LNPGLVTHSDLIWFKVREWFDDANAGNFLSRVEVFGKNPLRSGLHRSGEDKGILTS
jgi:hypothetical protein